MNERWTKEKANEWYAKQPWLVGCNFIPSNAINQLEMWQKETFDPETIRMELEWAKSLGFNTIRVYLHDILWHANPEAFKSGIKQFLEITSGLSIRPIFVIFDACWNPSPKLGKQPKPIPGIHNSGWVQSPRHDIVDDPECWPRLEMYVRELLRAFAYDERILMWDLYNEPGNSELAEKSLPLLEAVFKWAREVNPAQPLTSGIWIDKYKKINEFLFENDDIITFHDYWDADHLSRQIKELKSSGRPLICTEYLARTKNSRFETFLPVFKKENVGCLNWGLVAGKTQTIYPWGSPENAPEPEIWHHDIFRKDGTPYIKEETEFIRKITRVG